jgi:hypothetical protein
MLGEETPQAPLGALDVGAAHVGGTPKPSKLYGCLRGLLYVGRDYL